MPHKTNCKIPGRFPEEKFSWFPSVRNFLKFIISSISPIEIEQLPILWYNFYYNSNGQGIILPQSEVFIMVIRESAEDYLETILVLKNRLGNVRSIDIAHELSFSKPSVSVAMKNLRLNNYITVDENGYINLTDSGMAIAGKIYERHTFLTSFLTSIGVDPETAAEDACKIEHVISSESFSALKNYLADNENN